MKRLLRQPIYIHSRRGWINIVDAYGNTTKIEGKAAHENKIRFSTKEYDDATGLYYYGYRYYDPITGRWLSRDPIEEEGGPNLYAFVHNNPVNAWDRLGLYSLTDAEVSLLKRKVPQEGADGKWNPLISYSKKQIFDEWIRLEKSNLGWLEKIPECPDKICIEDGKPKNCDNGEWKKLGEASKKFHPGSKWCMRSKDFGGSSQQCCYDEEGKLRTDLPAAGTPDRVTAGGIGHFEHDVEPYNLSEKLGRINDYGVVRPPSKGGGSCYKK